ncbi:Nudix hydrolase 14 [Durusdinium trenchii]|uniref:Chloroplastic n=1 Tax=Durusdinium trenchii TaxID=1381693 RepID=A0ABP0QHL0_9DINO
MDPKAYFAQWQQASQAQAAAEEAKSDPQPYPDHVLTGLTGTNLNPVLGSFGQRLPELDGANEFVEKSELQQQAGPAGTSKGTLQLVLCVVSSAVVLGIIGSIVFGLASLVGLIFGSVSLATVVRAGSTLPSNAVFSQMLGLRPLVRDDVLGRLAGPGTLVTISGIVSFTIFQGWAFYQHSRSEYLMHMARPASLVWQGFLLIAQVSSVCWLCNNRSPPRDRKEERGPARKRAVAATMICACSSAFMDLAAKGWSSFHVKEDDFIGHPLSVLPVAKQAPEELDGWGTIYGCRRCDVLIFVPLNTTANIILSVASGMICLAEYRSVKSWPGLVTAGVSMLCGIFMLVTGPAETTPSTTLSIVDSEGGRRTARELVMGW